MRFTQTKVYRILEDISKDLLFDSLDREINIKQVTNLQDSNYEKLYKFDNFEAITKNLDLFLNFQNKSIDFDIEKFQNYYKSIKTVGDFFNVVDEDVILMLKRLEVPISWMFITKWRTFVYKPTTNEMYNKMLDNIEALYMEQESFTYKTLESLELVNKIYNSIQALSENHKDYYEIGKLHDNFQAFDDIYKLNVYENKRQGKRVKKIKQGLWRLTFKMQVNEDVFNSKNPLYHELFKETKQFLKQKIKAIENGK